MVDTPLAADCSAHGVARRAHSSILATSKSDVPAGVEIFNSSLKTTAACATGFRLRCQNNQGCKSDTKHWILHDAYLLRGKKAAPDLASGTNDECQEKAYCQEFRREILEENTSSHIKD
jgi:hypothetical protein